jgi:hypothetical protein
MNTQMSINNLNGAMQKKFNFEVALLLTEHINDLNEMQRNKFDFEIAMLLSNNLETINSNIDKSIEMIQLHMVRKRLINESATRDSIGILYNLPFACLMAIASA